MSLVFDLGNAKLNQLMKERLDARAGERILEIGCGTGKLLAEIASRRDGVLMEGVDISETMLTIASKRNQKAITEGRVILQHGDFNEIVFKENAYDAICSCNTIYFWPDPLVTLRKIHSILKPGGRLVIAFEDDTRMESKPIKHDMFHIYSQKELAGVIKRAGFDGKVDYRELTGKSSGLCCAAVFK